MTPGPLAEADAGAIVSISVPVSPRIFGEVGAGGPRSARFRVLPETQVRWIGELEGEYRWEADEAAILPVAFALSKGVAAGPVKVARVILQGTPEVADTVLVRVRVRRHRDVWLRLPLAERKAPPGAETTVPFVVHNRGNAPDTVILELETSRGMHVEGLPASAVVARSDSLLGELRVRVARESRPGSTGFVRLAVTGRERRISGTTLVTIGRHPSRLARIPARVTVGSTATTAGGPGPEDLTLAAVGAGEVAPGVDLAVAYRRLPADGPSFAYRGGVYGPRAEAHLRSKALDLSAGELSVPTSAVNGSFLAGTGGAVAWRSGRLELRGSLARPRASDGSSASGHLAQMAAEVRHRLGSVGILLTEHARAEDLWGGRGEVRSALLRFAQDAASAHWASVDVGAMRVVDGGAGARATGLALDATYRYRSPRGSLDLRGRTVPLVAQGMRVPPRAVSGVGVGRLRGPLAAVAGGHVESAPAAGRFAGTSVAGAEAGLRLEAGPGQIELTGNERRTRRGEHVTRLQTVRLAGATSLGDVYFEGSAEIGSSWMGDRRAPAQRLRGGATWTSPRGWVRGSLWYGRDVAMPRSAGAEVGGAYEVLPGVQIFGSAGSTLDSVLAGAGWQARLGAQVDLSPEIALHAGVERASEGLGAASRWIFTLGATRALLLPIPVPRRTPVGGLVFEDRDGDGRRHAEEPGLAGIRLLMGRERAVSGADGRFRFDSEEEAPVHVDPVSLPPGFLAPEAAPVPDSRHAAVPLTRAAGLRIEVFIDGNGDGLRDAEDGAAGGALVSIVDERGATWHMRTAADGGVTLGALRPGRYRVSVDPASLPPLTRGPDAEDVSLQGGAETRLTLPVQRRLILYRTAKCGAEGCE